MQFLDKNLLSQPAIHQIVLNNMFLLLTPCIKHRPEGIWPQGQLWSPQVLVWYHTLIFTRQTQYAAYTMPRQIRSPILMCIVKYFAYITD